MTVLGKVVAICTDIFTEAVVDNIALGDDGFNNFLENVLLNENLCSLKMSNCKVLSANSLRGLKNALKSKHKSLRALDLHGNARLGDAGVEALAKSIGLAALESLDLGDCGFTARGMKELAIAINSAHIINSLQRLDLSANPLRKEGGAMVGACVQNLLNLRKLNLPDTDVQVASVLQAFIANQAMAVDNLVDLNLARCRLGRSGCALAADFLEKNVSLRRLSLSGTKMSLDELAVLMGGVYRNADNYEGRRSKLILDLSFNDFVRTKAPVFRQVNRTVFSLDISHCFVQKSALRETLESLRNLKRLAVLRCDGNVRVSSLKAVGDPRVGVALADLAFANPRLQFMSFQGGIGDNFCARNSLNSFFERLGTNGSLQWLSVARNRFGAEELAAVVLALRANKALAGLDIDENKMSLSALVDLFGALKESTSLLGLIPEKDVAEHLTSSKKSEQKLQMVMALENSRARLANNRKMLLGNADLLATQTAPLGPQFGVDLLDLVGKTKLERLSSRVPTVLIQMAKYLFQNNGHLLTGVFRLAPDKSELENVREQINTNLFDWNHARVDKPDVNCIATCLKQWFRDIPGYLLPLPLLKSIQDIPNINNADFSFLPVLENYILSDNEALLSSWRTSLFIWLSSLVGEISKYSHLNKMSPTNMAIVISPNLFNPDILQNRGLSELGQRLFVEMIIYQLRQDIGPDLLGFSYDTPLDVPPPVPPLETAIMALVADAKETKSTAEDVLTENTKDSLSSEDEPKATARDEANVIKEGKLRSKTLMDITKVSCSEEESGTRRTAEAQLRAVSMASEPVLKRKSDQDRMGK